MNATLNLFAFSGGSVTSGSIQIKGPFPRENMDDSDIETSSITYLKRGGLRIEVGLKRDLNSHLIPFWLLRVFH